MLISVTPVKSQNHPCYATLDKTLKVEYNIDAHIPILKY